MNIEEQARELLYQARDRNSTELHEAFKDFIMENLYALHGTGEYYFLLSGNVVQFRRHLCNEYETIFELKLPNHFSNRLLKEIFVDFLNKFELSIENTVHCNSSSIPFVL